MPARLSSAALQGIDAQEVSIEVDVLAGLPSFTVVGLGDTAVKESKERLTAALTNLGYEPPRRKTIVSLAPASLKKEGSHYDLAITLAYLIASKQISILPSPKIGEGQGMRYLEKSWFIGEIGLDGSLRPVNGVLPIALAAARSNIKTLFVPAGNRHEAAAAADQLDIYAPSTLQNLINHLTGEQKLAALKPNTQPRTLSQSGDIDFQDIRGQDHAKRALLIAAAGGHNVLLVGPPGTGKTLLARALAGILPPLTRHESHIVTSLYSVAGLLDREDNLISQRPFRSPHHGASSVALIGGGTRPKPGEVSLAHTGVLFLDELPEFPRGVLDQLRQPLEDGVVTVSRAAGTVQFPARCILVGAMNPCKCGYLGSTRKDCTCTATDVVRYQQRISGPLLDRFDLHVMVNDIPIEELLDPQTNNSDQSSTDFSHQSLNARSRQLKRQSKPNSELNLAQIKQYCVIDQLSSQLLIQAQTKFQLSARGTHRLLKVSRTLADLDGQDDIQSQHIAEALQYREQLKAALPDFV